MFLNRRDKETPHMRSVAYYGMRGDEDSEEMSFCYYVTDMIFMKD